MLRLKKGDDWGSRLVVRLTCGHESEIVREHVNAQGVYVGRLECQAATESGTCGRIYELVKLEGWRP